MPRGDKTGPQGLGSKTGREAGYCAGFPVPGYMNPTYLYGRGLGRRRGKPFGRGWGRGFGGERFVYSQPIELQPVFPSTHQTIAQPQSPELEIAELENYKLSLDVQKGTLERELDDVTARIEELQKTILRKNDQ